MFDGQHAEDRLRRFMQTLPQEDDDDVEDGRVGDRQ